MRSTNRANALEMAIEGGDRGAVIKECKLAPEDVAWIDNLRPSPFLAPNRGNGIQVGSKRDDYYAMLNEAYDDGGCVPLSMSTYDTWAEQVKASSKASNIVNIFGSWKEACGQAGIKAGESSRAATGYTHKWTDDAAMSTINNFVEWCIDNNKRVTAKRYEQYRKSEGGPSLSILRRRLGDPLHSMKQKAQVRLSQIHRQLLYELRVDAATENVEVAS